MDYKERYASTDIRNAFCEAAAANGYRLLHDDFDEGWIPGDEPVGTLAFTDVIKEAIPEPPRLIFYASPLGQVFGKRLRNIEDFLKEAYPE